MASPTMLDIAGPPTDPMSTPPPGQNSTFTGTTDIQVDIYIVSSLSITLSLLFLLLRLYTAMYILKRISISVGQYLPLFSDLD